MSSEVKWLVLSLRPVGHVTAPNQSEAIAEAQRLYGASEVAEVRSCASLEVEIEEQAALARRDAMLQAIADARRGR